MGRRVHGDIESTAFSIIIMMSFKTGLLSAALLVLVVLAHQGEAAPRLNCDGPNGSCITLFRLADFGEESAGPGAVKKGQLLKELRSKNDDLQSYLKIDWGY